MIVAAVPLRCPALLWAAHKAEALFNNPRPLDALRCRIAMGLGEGVAFPAIHSIIARTYVSAMHAFTCRGSERWCEALCPALRLAA